MARLCSGKFSVAYCRLRPPLPLAPSITFKYPPGKFLAIVVQLKALLNSSHEFNKKLEISYKFAQYHIQELSVGQHARLFSVLDGIIL
jgi:hypothetical protein